MNISPLAGKPAPPSMLVNVPRVKGQRDFLPGGQQISISADT